MSVILAWHDLRNSPDPGDIYAQKLNSNGIPQWTVNGVAVTTAFGLQEKPLLGPDSSGGAVFVWQDHRAGAGNSDIYAQRLNASSLPQWIASDVPVSTAPGDQSEPAIVVAYSPTDPWTGIAWTDSRAGDQDVYAQVLNVAGGPQWTLDGVPVAVAPGEQRRPVIRAFFTTAFWLVAWEDDRNGGDSDVYAQRLGLTGAPVWTANGVQVASTPNARMPVAVDNGEAYLAWQDERNGPGNIDVFAQRLNASGAPVWQANGITVSGATGNQTAPVAEFVSDGTNPSESGLIVAWEDARNGLPDVYAQRIPASGIPAWTPDGVAVSTAPGRQGRISITSVNSVLIAGAVLVWEDDRNAATSTDIYAAKISTTGVLPAALTKFSVE